MLGVTSDTGDLLDLKVQRVLDLKRDFLLSWFDRGFVTGSHLFDIVGIWYFQGSSSFSLQDKYILKAENGCFHFHFLCMDFFVKKVILFYKRVFINIYTAAVKYREYANPSVIVVASASSSTKF